MCSLLDDHPVCYSIELPSDSPPDPENEEVKRRLFGGKESEGYACSQLRQLKDNITRFTKAIEDLSTWQTSKDS